MMDECKHFNFECKTTVNRLEDIGRFQADIKINCKDCGKPFRFVGLPVGLNLNGASVSFEGTEGRFAILPEDKNNMALPLTGFIVQ